MDTIRKMLWVTAPDTLEIRETPLDAPGPGMVRIKTAYSALCGSDMHLYHGKHPFVKLPSTIGHELSGVIDAVGPEVSGLKPGDRVVPEPILTCGVCDNCRRGNYHMCRNVSFGYRKGEAGYGTYYMCSADRIHLIPEGISLKAAALTEPLSVAVHGAEKAGNLLGKTVAVLGAGTIGALTAAVCRAKGAGRVMIVDRSEFRLDLAAGPIRAEKINALEKDPVDAVLELTPEFIDRTDVFLSAIEAVKIRDIVTINRIVESAFEIISLFDTNRYTMRLLKTLLGIDKARFLLNFKN